MSRLLCCVRARRADMGAALSHPQEGEACDGAGLPAAPPTMADVIRERKKKAGGAGLGTLRRRIANAARRPRDNRPDRGCEHARFIRSVVSSWRLAEVFLLCEELEAAAALRDLGTQADLAREPACDLPSALPHMYTDRWWCDVELVGAGWSIPAHRAILAARSTYFRDLLQRYPPSCTRVPLEGACASIPREEADACIYALYSGGSTSRRANCRHHNKYERDDRADGDLDLVDNTGACRTNSTCTCTSRRVSCRRAAALLGVTRDPLHVSMRYLLDSGEMSDTKLVFYAEGGAGGSYGFRTSVELPVHRVVLAARSRFFRSVMSRRGAAPGAPGAPGGGGGTGAVCVDEKVLPRRFARALLHAAYTDQVDLSLIMSNRVAPRDNAAGAAWAGMGRHSACSSRPTLGMLDDAFQLYEIARFLEMPIVVQGCEDAIVEALTPDTLSHVLRWTAASHASQWVHRQAMRYLRDEFVTITSSPGAASIPRAALSGALASPFLQASEPCALRALLRWGADHKHLQREPNVVWHTAHSVSRRGARRRELSDAALREILSPLISHVRIEHIPQDNELLQQLVRRGIVPPPPGGGGAGAWLGRGDSRPARCFLPYLDEIKALLEDQTVPEEELARARRTRYMQRIPDTLYMVAATRNPSPSPSESGACSAAARACVSPRALRSLRARARELRAAIPARTAARHSHHAHQVYRQIALRAVREMSLPDACAELLLNDSDDDTEQSAVEGWESPHGDRHRSEEPEGCHRGWPDGDQGNDCCRTLSGSGSLRCASTGSLRSAPSLHIPMDNSRTGTCSRREQPARTESAHHSIVVSDDGTLPSHEVLADGSPNQGASFDVTWFLRKVAQSDRQRDSNSSGEWCVGGRLSAAVPDVAMAPNANTHLLTHRDYFRHPPPWEYGGVVLQLDLGDGATHTPRPGSRAQRNSSVTQQHSTRQREHAHQVSQAISCLRARSDDDELRAAIELSVMRAYSSFHGRGGGAASAAAVPQPQPHRSRAAAATLPQPYRNDLPPAVASGASPRLGGRPSVPTAPSAPAARPEQHPHLALPAPSPSPSPRRRDYSPRIHHDYRLDAGSYGGSASTSRGHSPNNYA